MSWGRLDGNIATNGKVGEATEDGKLVFVAALALNIQHGVGGAIPASHCQTAARLRTSASAWLGRMDDARIEAGVASCLEVRLLRRLDDGGLQLVGYGPEFMPSCVRCHRPNPQPSMATCPDCRLMKQKEREERAHKRLRRSNVREGRVRAENGQSPGRDGALCGQTAGNPLSPPTPPPLTPRDTTPPHPRAEPGQRQSGGGGGPDPEPAPEPETGITRIRAEARVTARTEAEVVTQLGAAGLAGDVAAPLTHELVELLGDQAPAAVRDLIAQARQDPDVRHVAAVLPHRLRALLERGVPIRRASDHDAGRTIRDHNMATAAAQRDLWFDRELPARILAHARGDRWDAARIADHLGVDLHRVEQVLADAEPMEARRAPSRLRRDRAAGETG